MKNYQNNVRGTYLDYATDNVSLPMAKNTTGLIQLVKKYLSGSFDTKLIMKFYQQYCLWENETSTHKLLDYVFNDKKYYVKEESNEIVGSSLTVSDGASIWNHVYGSQNTKLIANIKKEQTQNFKAEKVAALYDPINIQRSGELYVAFHLDGTLVWIAINNVNRQF